MLCAILGAMDSENLTWFRRLCTYATNSWAGRLFLDKKFLHYTWIGLGISGLNVLLLWLFIDVFEVPTVISSIIVLGGTFIFRYILFTLFKIF